MAKKSAKGLYLRPDGLYEKTKTIKGKRYVFRNRDPDEVMRQYYSFEEEQEKGPLFKDVAEDWAKEHFPSLTHNTRLGYQTSYLRIQEEFGDERVSSIRAPDIDKYIKRFSKSRAYKTVANELLIFRLILEHACTKGYVEINPAQYIKVPKGLSRQRRQYPTDAEIKAVQNDHEGVYGLLFYFVMYTGCRLGEALAMQWKDIDFKTGRINVSKSVYYDGTLPCIKQPKTEKGTRWVVLLDKLKYTLEPLKGKPDEYLFLVKGKMPTKSAVDKGKIRYQKRIGITVGPHSLRHAFATMLFEAGTDPKVAQFFLGHAQLSTTMDIYTEMRERQLRKEANRLKKYDYDTGDTQDN